MRFLESRKLRASPGVWTNVLSESIHWVINLQAVWFEDGHWSFTGVVWLVIKKNGLESILRQGKVGCRMLLEASRGRSCLLSQCE